MDELLAAFDLAERADDKVGEYSKGMKQRLALARTVIHEPTLLFLDEPTAALDPVAARQVHEMILQHGPRGAHGLHQHPQPGGGPAAVRPGGRDGAWPAGGLGTPHELARRWCATCQVEFELAPDSAAQALQALQAAAPGVASAGQRNGAIVVSGAEREAIPDLIAALVSAGVRIYQVTPQEPTLEDVYFALHSDAEVKQ